MKKKTNGKKYKVFLCPICGNDLPYNYMFSKYHDIRCDKCRHSFLKSEVVVELRKVGE